MKTITGLRYITISLFIVVATMIAVPSYAQTQDVLPLIATQVNEQQITVFYNNEAISFFTNPLIEDGTTLVEFRTIFEKLGLEVAWVKATKTVIGKKEGLTVEFSIGNLIAKVNGVDYKLQSAPKIIGTRTMVPLRFVGEAAGSYVEWNNKSREINLYRISPDDAVTANNHIHVQGKVPADIRWVRFGIVKDKSEDVPYEFVQPINGIVDSELYLSDGAGGYRIEVYQTKLNDEHTVLYERNSTIQVTNYGNSGIQLKSDSTNNSKLTVFGELDQEEKEVLLIAINDATNDSKRIYMKPVDGRVQEDIYLSLGEGKYTLEVYTMTDDAPEQYFYKKSMKAVNYDVRDPDLVPSEMVESNAEEIVLLAQQITQGLNTDSIKSRAIHDWVAGHIMYDAATFLSGGDRVDTALATLHGKLTDCDGYARLNAALHRAVGIKAKVIIGTVIDLNKAETWDQAELDKPNHAWNEVFFDGRWVTQDPTWNAGYIDFYTNQYVSSLSHNYYDQSPEAFALDHVAFAKLGYKYE